MDSTPRPVHAYLAMPDAASPAPGRMGLGPCLAGPYHREVAAFPHSPSGHGFVTYCCAMLWKLCYVVHVMHVLHAATWSRQMQYCMPPGICPWTAAASHSMSDVATVSLLRQTHGQRQPPTPRVMWPLSPCSGRRMDRCSLPLHE